MRAFNSTIRIKEKPCSRCGRVGPIFSKGRCKSCATIESIAAKDEKEAVEDLGSLIDELDAIFSKYIRLKYSDKDGNCECFTCNTKKRYQELHNGHYISRSHMFLRWDERNCKPQCEYCNCTKHGNLAIYGQKLEQLHPGITDILLEESRTIYKHSRTEIKAIISDYSKRLKLLNKNNHV